jgi:hypothetical protein
MGSRSPVFPAARVLALALIAGGGLLMVAAAFADQLNLSGGGSGLGWKQLIAMIAGLVLFLIGVAWLLQPKSEAEGDLPGDSPE